MHKLLDSMYADLETRDLSLLSGGKRWTHLFRDELKFVILP